MRKQPIGAAVVVMAALLAHAAKAADVAHGKELAVAVDEAGGRPDERLGGGAIDRHGPETKRPSACGL